MGLEQSCQSYVGGLVAVKPIYGWGWLRLDVPEEPVPAEVNGVSRPFQSRVQVLFKVKGELRGAIARVEEPGHIYDSLWMFFYNQIEGSFNFTENLPRCALELGAVTPTFTGEWPEFTDSSPLVSGWGIVGASLAKIDDFDS